MLWRYLTNAIIEKTLLFKKGAKLKATSSAGVITEIDMTELAAINNVAAADLQKIVGITNGTAIASKAIVLDANKDASGVRFLRPDATNAITAFAGGGQGSAVALTAAYNRITVCATAGDSVKLPAATAGLAITVTSAVTSGKGHDVFPATGEAINNLAANSAIRQPPGTTIKFVCDVAGTWNVTIPQPDAKFTTRALSSSTAAAGELTGAKWVTMNNSGATPGNYTTRTAAQMIADGFYQVGDSYNLRIVNGQGTGTLTLVAGDGNVTITGTATALVNTFRDFVVTITAAGTLTIQSVGTGVFS